MARIYQRRSYTLAFSIIVFAQDLAGPKSMFSIGPGCHGVGVPAEIDPMYATVMLVSVRFC
jgi:hypothetical protein